MKEGTAEVQIKREYKSRPIVEYANCSFLSLFVSEILVARQS